MKNWTKLEQDRANWQKLIGDVAYAPKESTARDDRAAGRGARA